MKNLASLASFYLKVSILCLIGFSAQAKKMIIIGDSLTEGYGVAKEAAYPNVLQNLIQKNQKVTWEVVNSGVSGSTTASAVSRVRWALKAKPDLVLLALGANDGLRGIKTEGSEKNLAAAVDLLKQAKIPVILAAMKMPPNYGDKYTVAFENMFTSVAKEKSVPLMPFLLDNVAGNPELNLTDGIHPNERGHKIVADNVYRFIKDFL